MRLIRSLFTLTLFGALAYAAYAVPLGQRTLWEHLRAIAGTSESQKLVEEVKQKAGEVIQRDGASAKASQPSARGDELTPEERRLLRRLIKDKLEQTKSTAQAPPEPEPPTE
jgi:uncharacterized membrane protein